MSERASKRASQPAGGSDKEKETGRWIEGRRRRERASEKGRRACLVTRESEGSYYLRRLFFAPPLYVARASVTGAARHNGEEDAWRRGYVPAACSRRLGASFTHAHACVRARSCRAYRARYSLAATTTATTGRQEQCPDQVCVRARIWCVTARFYYALHRLVCAREPANIRSLSQLAG